MEKGDFFKYHKRGDGDCLSKTQDFAKFNYDVQSLTPAQFFTVNDYKFCLLVEAKVNGGCNSDGPKVAKFIGG